MEVELYSSAQDRCEVGEFISSLDNRVKKKVQRDLELIEKYGQEAFKAMKIRKMNERKFWEIKIEINKIAVRLFWVIRKGEMWLLHGFVKKSQVTPKKELDIAEQRLKDLDLRILSNQLKRGKYEIN